MTFVLLLLAAWLVLNVALFATAAALDRGRDPGESASPVRGEQLGGR